MRIHESEEIAGQLGDHPNYTGGAEDLSRAFTAPDFLAAIELVNRVAAVAEEVGHHPDIAIRWNTVRFRLTTHSAGGVTDLDLELARRIEEIIVGAAPDAP